MTDPHAALEPAQAPVAPVAVSHARLDTLVNALLSRLLRLLAWCLVVGGTAGFCFYVYLALSKAPITVYRSPNTALNVSVWMGKAGDTPGYPVVPESPEWWKVILVGSSISLGISLSGAVFLKSERKLLTWATRIRVSAPQQEYP